jgi:hypothetical protein
MDRIDKEFKSRVSRGRPTSKDGSAYFRSIEAYDDWYITLGGAKISQEEIAKHVTDKFADSNGRIDSFSDCDSSADRIDSIVDSSIDRRVDIDRNAVAFFVDILGECQQEEETKQDSNSNSNSDNNENDYRSQYWMLVSAGCIEAESQESGNENVSQIIFALKNKIPVSKKFAPLWDRLTVYGLSNQISRQRLYVDSDGRRSGPFTWVHSSSEQVSGNEDWQDTTTASGKMYWRGILSHAQDPLYAWISALCPLARTVCLQGLPDLVFASELYWQHDSPPESFARSLSNLPASRIEALLSMTLDYQDKVTDNLYQATVELSAAAAKQSKSFDLHDDDTSAELISRASELTRDYLHQFSIAITNCLYPEAVNNQNNQPKEIVEFVRQLESQRRRKRTLAYWQSLKDTDKPTCTTIDGIPVRTNYSANATTYLVNQLDLDIDRLLISIIAEYGIRVAFATPKEIRQLGKLLKTVRKEAKANSTSSIRVRQSKPYPLSRSQIAEILDTSPRTISRLQSWSRFIEARSAYRQFRQQSGHYPPANYLPAFIPIPQSVLRVKVILDNNLEGAIADASLHPNSPLAMLETVIAGSNGEPELTRRTILTTLLDNFLAEYSQLIDKQILLNGIALPELQCQPLLDAVPDLRERVDKTLLSNIDVSQLDIDSPSLSLADMLSTEKKNNAVEQLKRLHLQAQQEQTVEPEPEPLSDLDIFNALISGVEYSPCSDLIKWAKRKGK